MDTTVNLKNSLLIWLKYALEARNKKYVLAFGIELWHIFGHLYPSLDNIVY